MADRYLSELLTPAVGAAQDHYYGRRAAPPTGTDGDSLGEAEVEFIARRDSFYMATISSSGWPYLQHRGGPAGFLAVLDPRTLAFADLKGNRQLITTGNVSENDRAALFLMDYPRRQRLKLLGHARVLDARVAAELADRVAPAGLRRRVERVVTIELVGFDWNCPAYITPRYTEAEIREAVASGWAP
jgi:predicted pyridoxine 5'-phosphate oxidase superfamily flavin-nucleotide-binding protein